MNQTRRDRFTRRDGAKMDLIDNEVQMLVDNHNDHDAGRKGWNHVDIYDGANKRMGVATLSSGTKTVSNTTVTADTRIILSRQAPSGTLGHLSVGTIVPATSFVINSSSGTEASVIAWLLIEPK